MSDELYIPATVAYMGNAKRGRVIAVLAVLALICMMLAGCGDSKSDAPAHIAPPAEFDAALWAKTLGGDQAVTPAKFAELSDPANSNVQDPVQAADIARRVVMADATGAGRGSFGIYFAGGTGRNAVCHDVAMLGANVRHMPVASDGSYAKAIVVYNAVCPDDTPDPHVNYVYMRKSDQGWTPLREIDVPQRIKHEVGADVPASYQMKEFSKCGNPENAKFKNRIEVVDAFDIMCHQAESDGVHLTITSAYRNASEQAELFSKAVSQYGSQAKARRWVAYANKTRCDSRHCAGAAVDLDVDDAASNVWLHATVGCFNPSTHNAVAATSCDGEAVPVERIQLYSFAAPLAAQPWYLDYTGAIDEGPNTTVGARLSTCAPGRAISVPAQIAAIWRCRLGQAGYDQDVTDHIAAEAVVVAKCESGFNSEAVIYAGKYLNVANPATGELETAAGIFQLTREDATRVLAGGYKDVKEPQANIDGAARLYISQRRAGGDGFSQWGCVRGNVRSGGTSVLPEYGGPALPSWAATY